MKYLKQIWNYLKITLSFFFGFWAVYFLFVGLLGIIPVHTNYDSSSDSKHEVYIWSNGMHTDFLMPLQSELGDWSDFVKPSHFRRGDSTFRYISFGWGEKEFYANTPNIEALNFSTFMRGAFVPSAAAMQVSYRRNVPKLDDQTRLLELDDYQFKILYDYIKSSFIIDASQKPIPVISEHVSNYAYFEAHQTYHLFRSCNNWINTGLKQAKVKTGVWTPLGWAILYHLD